ncbi:hypothetical protein FIBSPDRAFT_827254 [Athelia psychrophila]|uniref:Uncharacterized protein n=1 Tax=Athelia psychrophila TaxID=1759441 RepID=A0A166ITK7_9AGAM|nr:hypothetical protein FIBSPDRAFT_827254 [Fibularhizoctonia sp. CBS 109695]
MFLCERDFDLLLSARRLGWLFRGCELHTIPSTGTHPHKANAPLFHRPACLPPDAHRRLPRRPGHQHPLLRRGRAEPVTLRPVLLPAPDGSAAARGTAERRRMVLARGGGVELGSGGVGCRSDVERSIRPRRGQFLFLLFFFR